MVNKNVLVFSPHADDATIFIGGTLAKLAAEGRKIYIARVTNDDFDSNGLDQATTIQRNREESENAYRMLGAVEIIHMGYKSDYMISADYNKLRGEIVELIRKIRPYTLFSFDVDMSGETNMDHKVISSAVAEALWVASFRLHYPEQIENGLEPFSVPETINFSTAPNDQYSFSDIAETINKKIEALKCHKTPINNMLQSALLSAECAEMETEMIEGIINSDRDSVIDLFARNLANGVGEPFGLEYGEMINIHPAGLGIFGE